MTDDAAFGRKNQLDISQIASAEVDVSHIENTPGKYSWRAGAWTAELVVRLRDL